MSRVHIGLKGSRMGAWVTAAGDDASAENSRFILSSEGDMLVPHEVKTGRHDADSEDAVTGWFWFAQQTVMFTTPLSYIPLVFVNVNVGDGPRAYYPISLQADFTDGPDDPYSLFYSTGYKVRADRVIFDGANMPWDHFNYNITVFKNKLIP